jgi:hypothetical protein
LQLAKNPEITIENKITFFICCFGASDIAYTMPENKLLKTNSLNSWQVIAIPL